MMVDFGPEQQRVSSSSCRFSKSSKAIASGADQLTRDVNTEHCQSQDLESFLTGQLACRRPGLPDTRSVDRCSRVGAWADG